MGGCMWKSTCSICWLLAIGTGIGFVMEASCSVVAWADCDFAGLVVEAVEGKGKIDAGVA